MNDHLALATFHVVLLGMVVAAGGCGARELAFQGPGSGGSSGIGGLGSPTPGPGGVAGSAGGFTTSCATTTMQALDILSVNCGACHDGQSADAHQGVPPFDFVLDIDKLEVAVSASATDLATGQAARFLIAGAPDSSLLYQRIVSGQMPPPDAGNFARPRPTTSDLSVLRYWIESCVDSSSVGSSGAGGSLGRAGSSAAGGGSIDASGPIIEVDASSDASGF